MQFFFKVLVKHEGMTLDELWKLWEEEAEAARPARESGKMKAYKVVGQRRVLGIIEADSHDELDRMIMAGLPMSNILEFEEIWPVREYDAFAEDVKARWQ